ncbi:hypothetical protein TYRP_003986 [Tyrophagus putrescentiae]|nr:hypothetical protein TYRP_003986 [Tyrophagus putrescentiae]
MSTSTAQLSPSILHYLVDNFFEGKKALVKERLRNSMENIVNDLFDEMVGQVKEMLLSPKEATAPAAVPWPLVDPMDIEMTLPAVDLLPSQVVPKVTTSTYSIGKQGKKKKCKGKKPLVIEEKHPCSDSDDDEADVIANSDIVLPGTSELLPLGAAMAEHQVTMADAVGEGSSSMMPTYYELKPAALDNYTSSNFIGGQSSGQLGDNGIGTSAELKSALAIGADNGGGGQNAVGVGPHSSVSITNKLVLNSGVVVSKSGKLNYRCKWPKCTYTTTYRQNCNQHIRACHFKHQKTNAKGEGPSKFVESFYK